jgi:putative NADH-flavin reductase
MKVIVFGSTGQTGLQIIDQLVKTNHQVTAFARSPAKLSDYKTKINIVTGDARDAVSVSKAVSGQDAVLHALSESITEKSDIQTVFAENLINAMQTAKVKRLVVLSARGTGDSRKQVPPLFGLVLKTVLKNLSIDKEKAEKKISASNLDYTYVRPFILANGKFKGNAITSENPKKLKWRINRADVAKCMILQIESTEWIRKAPFIGYPR